MKYAGWTVVGLIVILLGAMITFYVTTGYYPNSFTEIFEFFF
jgi:hypothetical protein